MRAEKRMAGEDAGKMPGLKPRPRRELGLRSFRPRRSVEEHGGQAKEQQEAHCVGHKCQQDARAECRIAAVAFPSQTPEAYPYVVNGDLHKPRHLCGKAGGQALGV